MTDIEPDTKDWTWVLDRPCAECGYDSTKITRADIPVLLRAHAADFTDALAMPDPHRRSAPTVWSLLEYACHVRDVCRVFDERLRMMLTMDHPLYSNWDQDATAVSDRYGEQDPKRVATELAEAAEMLAHRFEQVTEAEWQRTGERGDGAHFTVDTFARYFIHDVIHHVHDVSST